jgi:hypothetical protein
MIVVKLIGGLGNQMFQYAFAKNLALKHAVDLKLDVSGFSKHFNTANYTNRNFELDVFNINCPVASETEIASFQKSKFLKAIDYVSLWLPIKSSFFYLREPQFYYFRKATFAPKNTYIDGYWHSEKYFSSIRSVLLNDFVLSQELSADAQLVADEIKNKNAVAIHVRKGDYISSATNLSIYKTITADYYKDAMKRIADKFQDVVFYVFSDEPEWFRNNVKTDFATVYVDEKMKHKSYEDLYLMSLCKHNIIANSSFSWWGAWLNQHPDKMVVAPKIWYNDSKKNTKDLIPSNWIQL